MIMHILNLTATNANDIDDLRDRLVICNKNKKVLLNILVSMSRGQFLFYLYSVSISHYGLHKLISAYSI